MSVRRLVLDIETQQDFFHPHGSCYRPDSLAVAWRISRLFGWIRSEGISVVSTVLRLLHGELGPMGVAPHCISDTFGERKVPLTVLDRRINFGLRNEAHLPADALKDYQQLIFEKRHTDIFRHARAERLITRLELCTFILCGAGLAGGIAEAALGLRYRGFAVIVASDAVLDLGSDQAKMARKRMEAKGAIFLPTRRIIATGVPKRRRLPPARRAARHMLHR